jgi:hypothetical protein
MTYIGIALFALLFALVPALTLYALVGEMLRVRGLRRVAERLGFTFHSEGDEKTLAQMARFQLFPRSPSRAVRNLMQGHYGPAEVKLFDYQFVTDCGEGWATWTQTVLLLRLPAAEGYAEPADEPRLDEAAAPRSPGLDLYAGSEEAGYRLSREEEARLFQQARFVLCTEARGSWLLVCRKFERVDPPALEAFLEEGLQALTPFLAQDRRSG